MVFVLIHYLNIIAYGKHVKKRPRVRSDNGFWYDGRLMKEKLPAAVELGKRGGARKVPKGFSKMSKGRLKKVVKRAVAARLKKVGPKDRSEIARAAAIARWAKKKQS